MCADEVDVVLVEDVARALSRGDEGRDEHQYKERQGPFPSGKGCEAERAFE